MMSNLSDEELMNAIAAKNADAYKTLAERYMDDLFFLARRMLRNPAEAEDVVQTIFMRIWEAPTRWQSEKGRLKAWLWTITANACRDVMRRSGKTLNGASFDIALENAADLYPTPDCQIEARDHLNQTLKLIAVLPERQRTALYLSVYDELAHKDIAKIMNVSSDAVESLIARARKNIRQANQNKQNQNQKEGNHAHVHAH